MLPASGAVWGALQNPTENSLAFQWLEIKLQPQLIWKSDLGLTSGFIVMTLSPDQQSFNSRAYVSHVDGPSSIAGVSRHIWHPWLWWWSLIVMVASANGDAYFSIAAVVGVWTDAEIGGLLSQVSPRCPTRADSSAALSWVVWVRSRPRMWNVKILCPFPCTKMLYEFPQTYISKTAGEGLRRSIGGPP